MNFRNTSWDSTLTVEPSVDPSGVHISIDDSGDYAAITLNWAQVQILRNVLWELSDK